MCEANAREIVHLGALVRFLAYFVDWRHLSIVTRYPTAKAMALEEVGCLNVSVREQSVGVLAAFQITVGSRRRV